MWNSMRPQADVSVIQTLVTDLDHACSQGKPKFLLSWAVFTMVSVGVYTRKILRNHRERNFPVYIDWLKKQSLYLVKSERTPTFTRYSSMRDIFLSKIETKINDIRKLLHENLMSHSMNSIGKFITWRGNSALNCTRKPISHESRSDECDIGFQVQFNAEFTSQEMNFPWIA